MRNPQTKQIRKNKIIQTWLEKKIPNLTVSFIVNNNDDNIEEFLIKNEHLDLFNFIITVKYLYESIDFNETNPIEEILTEKMSIVDKEIFIIENITQVYSSVFNESLRKDWDFVKEKNLWIGVNLDAFYKTNLDHIKLDDHEIKKIKPKTFVKSKKLAIDIIKRNIIITSVLRLNNTILYNKSENKCDKKFEFLEHINFTKGYMVCIEPEHISKLKKYLYLRKLPQIKPTEVWIKKSISNVWEMYDNSFYSSPIWMSSDTVSLSDIKKKEKIFNSHLLNEKPKVENLIEIINFLNNTEFTINMYIFNKIINFLNNNTITDSLVTKTNILNGIHIIDENNQKGENEFIPQSLINSASCIELIANQIRRFPKFFLNYMFDKRTRLYVLQWPLNYQLSHIVRVSININRKSDMQEVFENFINHPSISEHIKDKKYMLQHEESINNIENIKEFIERNFGINIENKNTRNILIYEFVLIHLSKLSPKNIRHYEDKIKWALKNFDEFVNSKIEDEWELWCKKLQISKKKVIYVFSLQDTIKRGMVGDFDTMYWGDASSNAIQILVLRMGLFDEFLLKLTNIINNDTEWNNIYNYVCYKIKEKDHSMISKETKLKEETIRGFQNDEINKYLIMPSSYGMGMVSYRKNVDDILTKENNKKWIELTDLRVKNKIADYFWKTATEILKEINFDMRKYQMICNTLNKDSDKTKKYNIYVWKNDCDNTVAPISLKTSKRKKIKEMIEKIKLEKENTLNKDKIEEKEKIIEKLKEDLKKDEKTFWRRTMVKTSKKNIYSRIVFNPKIIDPNGVRQSVIPNSIHSCDAAILNIVSEICKTLKIEITVIHDSIGCKSLYAPLIKTIFKTAYIIILEKNSKEAIFPFKEKLEIPNKEKIFKMIIESKDFFR